MTKAEEFRRLLDRLAVTNREAANLLGVAERTIYKWMAGERPVAQSALLALRLLVEKHRGKR